MKFEAQPLTTKEYPPVRRNLTALETGRAASAYLVVIAISPAFKPSACAFSLICPA